MCVKYIRLFTGLFICNDVDGFLLLNNRVIIAARITMMITKNKFTQQALILVPVDQPWPHMLLILTNVHNNGTCNCNSSTWISKYLKC